MPIRKTEVFARRFERERWEAFGRWLGLQRVLSHLTQKDAAEKADISLRQWNRYEQGTSAVPREAIPALARAVNVPLGRMLVRAGYEASNSECDVDAYLGRIRDSIVGGGLAGALYQLFDLYHEIQRDRRTVRPPLTGMTSEDFVTAAMALDRLPAWLRAELIEYVQAAEDDGKEYDYPLIPKLRRELRQAIRRELPKAVFKSGGKDDVKD